MESNPANSFQPFFIQMEEISHTFLLIIAKIRYFSFDKVKITDNLSPGGGIISKMDMDEVIENAVFRILAEKYGLDAVQFWRTSAGNEVDFVLADVSSPHAIEVKYDSNQVKSGKYKLFNEAYPEIPLYFSWMNLFTEDFFRRKV